MIIRPFRRPFVDAIFDLSHVEDTNGNELMDEVSAETANASDVIEKRQMLSSDIELLIKDLTKLYLNDEYSDTILVVENERIPVLKSLLAVRSDCKALFFGNLAECNHREIKLPDTPSLAFKRLLKYLYNGEVDFSGLQVDTIIQMIQVAQKYLFFRFCFPYTVIELIDAKLRSLFSIENVLKIYEETKLFHLESLSCACLNFIDLNADAVVKHENFYHFASLPLLKEILLRDSFCADENDIFTAVHAWINFNKDALKDVDTEGIIESVRLPLIIGLERVVQQGCLDGHWDLAYNLSYRLRALELPDVDFLSPQFNTTTNGEQFSYKVNVSVPRYVSKACKGWARFKTAEYLTVTLEKRARINHIRMLLPARKAVFMTDVNEPTWLSSQPFKSYSYIIQISVDNENWDTIIKSHSDASTQGIRGISSPFSWQMWYFKPAVAKYLRILDGTTGNNESTWFYILAFECMFSSKQFDFEDGVLVPNFDVASVPYKPGITLPDVMFRTDCDLVMKYDACTKLLAVGCDNTNIISLQQPCIVDSMKFLLYDRDSKEYRYTVEVSADGSENFTLIVDRSDSWYTAWQLIKFPAQIVKCIRIKLIQRGPRRYDQGCRIVHFECPVIEGSSM
ncbi:BTB/POZ domain-containing protein 9-like protein [Leptotrombidium deliense]|uniref:BTB/POZ domain-containing protein 9-like protein n=1 Tax=Leptotrombidium deliense TaxID=299467 RepID=A0A443SQ67_9ACAR|nr:BTB/POZ domain-containing protein 9-like protein [Leptotrombidium deliense]